MDNGQERGRSPLKIAALAAGALALAGAIFAAVMGGYTPFYRAALQADPLPGFGEHVGGVEGIDYVARINENYYRGAYPRDRLEQLTGLGIRSVVNLRYLKRHHYKEEAEAAGLKYFAVPIHPAEPPTREEIDYFLDIVNDPANQPVYVHCTLGIDRTGLMSGIYRIEHDGWTNEKAVAEMEYFGHNELWIDLEDLLKTYPEGVESGDADGAGDGGENKDGGPAKRGPDDDDPP